MSADIFILRGSKVATAIVRPVAAIALATACIALAACAQQPVRLEESALSREREITDAMALPPPGGPAVIGVVERVFANAIQQEIVLSTSAKVPGQNTLQIQFFGPVGSSGGDTPLSDTPPSESVVAREMRHALPGIRMVRSPLYVQNSYGPFGYATGRSHSGDLCLYAWQRISGLKSDASLATRGSVQVRLRLCQTGATEDGLLAVMYGYTINSAFAGYTWNPYGTVPAADPRLGVTGQPIHPRGLSGSELITVSAPRDLSAPRPTRRPQPAAAAVVTSAPALPPVPVNAPVVPLPPALSSTQAMPQVPAPPVIEE